MWLGCLLYMVSVFSMYMRHSRCSPSIVSPFNLLFFFQVLKRALVCRGVFTHFLWSSAAGDSTLLRPDAQTYLEEEGANTADFIYTALEVNVSAVGTDPSHDSGEGHFD